MLGGVLGRPFLGRATAAEPAPAAERFTGWPISLNTSTLRGHKLPFTRVVEIAAQAGYAGLEPWPDELDRHVQAGGSLEDAGKRIKDLGLKVTGGIAFYEWMVDDEQRRAAGLEEAKKRIDQFARIGATHIAAPPAGDVKNVDLVRAAERYADLLKLAEGSGVVPAVEVWGFAGNGYRLGQCVCIALESHRPEACVLPDVYHLFKGGSGLDGVRRLNPAMLAGFHLNDYPAGLDRARAKDADRVYPGDGVAPLVQLFRDLRDIGYRGPMSIELFNPEYYKQDPLLVARTALEKTKRVIERALG
ncbi:MAG: hypothetical protein AMXMBFR83_08970 [Phycisphaerae bacterium]